MLVAKEVDRSDVPKASETVGFPGITMGQVVKTRINLGSYGHIQGQVHAMHGVVVSVFGMLVAGGTGF